MLSAEPTVLRSGNLEVRPAQRIALLDGVEMRLRPKTFDLLFYFVSNADRVLTKEDLHAYLWGDLSVSKNSLAQCIIELRKALGDDARRPTRILTVAKTGYRWAAAEDRISTPLPATRVSWGRRFRLPIAASLVLATASIAGAVWWHNSAQTVGPGTRQIAIARFENQSGQPDLDWLRDGLPDMVSTTMSRSGSLQLVSREQLYRKRTPKPGVEGALELARASGSQAVIVGSFSRLGTSMRVDARVFDVAGGALLGAENITVDDISKVLGQVDFLASRLAGRISSHSDKGDQPALSSLMTSNLEAYRNYTLGLEKAERYQTAEAVALFEKALALDPEFVMASARIGYAFAVTDANLAKGRPYLEKAFRNAAKLTERDRNYILAWYAIAHQDYADAIRRYTALVAAHPNDMESHRRLATLYRGESRHESALEVLQRALRVDGEDPKLFNTMAVVNSEMGRHAEAIAMAERYVAFDPTNVNALDSLALACLFAGEYARAEELLDRALTLDPSFLIAEFHRVSVYYGSGRVAKAIQTLRRLAERSSDPRVQKRAWNVISWICARSAKWADARAAAARGEQVSTSPDERWVLPRIPGRSPSRAESLPLRGRGSRWGRRIEEFIRAEEARLRGDQNSRLEHLRNMVRYPPSWGEYETLEDALGDALRELGRTDEAIVEYERALKLFPGLARARFHLAKAYAARGRMTESKAEMVRFRELWKNADADPI